MKELAKVNAVENAHLRSIYLVVLEVIGVNLEILSLIHIITFSKYCIFGHYFNF